MTNKLSTETAGEAGAVAIPAPCLFMVGDRVYNVALPRLTGTVCMLTEPDQSFEPYVRVLWDPATVGFCKGLAAWYLPSELDYWTRPESASEVARA